MDLTDAFSEQSLITLKHCFRSRKTLSTRMQLVGEAPLMSEVCILAVCKCPQVFPVLFRLHKGTGKCFPAKVQDRPHVTAISSGTRLCIHGKMRETDRHRDRRT